MESVTQAPSKLRSAAANMGERLKNLGRRGGDDIVEAEARGAASGTCPYNCFTGETLIATSEGLKAITEVKPGDQVWTRQVETGQPVLGRVAQLFNRIVTQLVILTIAASTIQATPDHPFWVAGRGWVLAGQLHVGDRVSTLDGETRAVDAIEHRTGEWTVYNFEVEGPHNYFVSDQRVLVHNCNGGGGSGGRRGSAGNASTGAKPAAQMNVGDAGHHVPAIRKAEGRIFEVSRGNKTRPTVHFQGSKATQARNHARLHRAEREFIGERRGPFHGSDRELFSAYRKAYKGMDDIRVNVRSPNGRYNLAKDVSPYEAVNIIQRYLKRVGEWDE